MTSKTKLWAAQTREYPDSVRLTPAQVLEWASSGTYDEQHRKTRSISMAIQYPNVVWYEIPGTTYRGFRYGERGEQYASIY